MQTKELSVAAEELGLQSGELSFEAKGLSVEAKELGEQASELSFKAN